jgi:hypothetical protein
MKHSLLDIFANNLQILICLVELISKIAVRIEIKDVLCEQNTVIKLI